VPPGREHRGRALTRAPGAPAAQRSLFHKMGWLDAPLFRLVASLRYASSAGAPTTPAPDHWRKVLVRP